jgi:hypothetical protein
VDVFPALPTVSVQNDVMKGENNQLEKLNVIIKTVEKSLTSERCSLDLQQN